MNKYTTMKKLLLTMVASLAFLAPASVLADSNLCPSPYVSSVDAQSSLPPGWADMVFYQPFLAMQEEMDRLNKDMNHLTQEAVYAAGNSNIVHEQLYPRVNMETMPKEYRIIMTVPGLDEKDLKVDVSADNTLTIRSEKNLVQKTSSGTEHAFGSFTQILTLPSDAEAARIHTSYKDGQYTVTLPRKGDGSQSSEQPEERGRSL